MMIDYSNLTLNADCVPFLFSSEQYTMAENFEDPNKKRRLDEEGTSSAFADSPAETRKGKLEAWLKPLNNEQLFKLLLDMYVTIPNGGVRLVQVTRLIHSAVR